MAITPPESLRRKLRDAKQLNEVTLSFRRYQDAAEDNAKLHIDRAALPLACRSGCSFCCYLHVAVLPHEVFAIAQFIPREFDQDQIAGLIKSLKTHVESVSHLSTQEHIKRNVICPLLVDNKCSIYKVRPFNCRRHHSLKLADCEYSFANPEDVDFPGSREAGLYSMWSGMTEAATSEFARQGFDTLRYELGAALYEALTDADCASRWMNRERPFLNTPSLE